MVSNDTGASTKVRMKKSNLCPLTFVLLYFSIIHKKVACVLVCHKNINYALDLM